LATAEAALPVDPFMAPANFLVPVFPLISLTLLSPSTESSFLFVIHYSMYQVFEKLFVFTGTLMDFSALVARITSRYPEGTACPVLKGNQVPTYPIISAIIV
jgi:hypothetical protein